MGFHPRFHLQLSARHSFDGDTEVTSTILLEETVVPAVNRGGVARGRFQFLFDNDGLAQPWSTYGYATIPVFNDYLGPNFDTSTGIGALEWSISIGGGRVPGRLEIAHWLADNFDDDNPDEARGFDLGSGVFSTGDLRIDSFSSAAIGDDPGGSHPLRHSKWRFVPSCLTVL